MVEKLFDLQEYYNAQTPDELEEIEQLFDNYTISEMKNALTFAGFHIISTGNNVIFIETKESQNKKQMVEEKILTALNKPPLMNKYKISEVEYDDKRSTIRYRVKCFEKEIKMFLHFVKGV